MYKINKQINKKNIYLNQNVAWSNIIILFG